jgi:hypothetical protein
VRFSSKRCLTAVTSLLFILVACGDSPKPESAKKKEPEKPPEPVTGRYAFHQMYAAARNAWATDAQGLRLHSIPLVQLKSTEDKSGAWQATFVSPSRQRLRSYTYSVIEAEGNLHKGVFAGLEEAYSGPRGQAKPFLIAALKTDTDEVYKTALAKSTEYVKKNPDKPINYVLELIPRFPNPAWRVIWGESVGTSNYSIFVDASTGEYLQTMR